MPQEPRLTQEEQGALTQWLREWIRQEESRGIPMENILISCGECGLVNLTDEMGEEENPAPFEEE